MVGFTSTETIRRVKRTFLQAVAGGTFTSIAVAALGGDKTAILVAACTAIGTVIASYAQNLMEDTAAMKDRRI